jgi:hypothetical protein
MSRCSAAPSWSAIKMRVELLPQSMAATASATDVDDTQLGYVDRVSHECPHRIGRTREIVRQVCVQALHADARAAHPAFGAHHVLTNRRRTPTLRVGVVRVAEFAVVYKFFEAVYTTLTFETAHGSVKIGIDQPEERGHRRAVAQMRLVLNDDRSPVKMAYDDREAAREWTTEQGFDDRLIVE